MNGYFNSNKRNIFLPKCNYNDIISRESDLDLTDKSSSSISSNGSNESLDRSEKKIIDKNVKNSVNHHQNNQNNLNNLNYNNINRNFPSKHVIYEDELRKDDEFNQSKYQHVDEQILKKKIHKSEIK